LDASSAYRLEVEETDVASVDLKSGNVTAVKEGETKVSK
jgi:hypothetical protein